MFPIIPKCQPGLDEEKRKLGGPTKSKLGVVWESLNSEVFEEVKEMGWSRSAGAAFGGGMMAQTSLRFPSCLLGTGEAVGGGHSAN